MIEYAETANEVLHVVDNARTAVQQARAAGKLHFGPRQPSSGASGDADDDPRSSATFNLLSDFLQTDAIVIDDRALNKEPFVVDRQKHRAQIVSSLDIIEDLTARGAITQVERRNLRHRLRAAGAMLVPVEAEEIVLAALRNRQNESSEFRAIRENIGLARVTEIPRFPSEIPWFGSFVTSAQHALMQIWKRQPDRPKAAALASAILDLRPDPKDWETLWGEAIPPNWSDAVRQIMTAGLAMPLELDDDADVQAYNEWLEENVLAPMRTTSPEFYTQVISRVQELVGNTLGMEDGDDPEHR